MKYNLENINKSQVFRDDDLSYMAFRKTLTPKYSIVWKDIAHAYFLIIFFVLLSLSLEHLLEDQFIFFIPIMAFALGLCFAHLRLFVHEAIHENIHPNKKKNDQIANTFLCSWFGIDINQTRKNHWTHHHALGTPDDAESFYFKNLSLRLIINHLIGVRLLNTIILRLDNYINNQKEIRLKYILLISFLLNTLLICSCISLGFVQSAFVWLIAALIFFPLFFELRQILEHRDDWADPGVDYSINKHGKTCRIFEGKFLSGFFGAAGFNKHLLHHWDPEISYTRFDELEDFLVRSPKCWVSIYDSKTTYFDTFLFLFMF